MEPFFQKESRGGRRVHIYIDRDRYLNLFFLMWTTSDNFPHNRLFSNMHSTHDTTTPRSDINVDGPS